MTDFEAIRMAVYAKQRLMQGCNLFRGDETPEQLLDLINDPQGRSWCVNSDFPDLEMARLLYDEKREECRERGIFVAENLVLEHPEWGQVTFVGNSEATVFCNDIKNYHIVALQGAKVRIVASGHAVVVYSASSSAKIEIEKEGDTAIVIRV